MANLQELVRRVEAVSDVVATACAILDELCALAPRVLFGVTSFEGPRALTIVESLARVGRTGVEFANHRAVYAQSAVQWNRWAVRVEDQRLASVHVQPRPLHKLNRYWALHDVREHRRLLVCEGHRALALLGASVVGDASLELELWSLIEERMAAGAHVLRAAWRVLRPFTGGADHAVEAHDTDTDACAYLAPDGVVLAASEWGAQTTALRYAQSRLRDRQWSQCHAFEQDGVAFELRASVPLQAYGGYELRTSPTAHLAELLDGLARGLTNQEVATLLGTTPRAVKKRLERLYTRYGASNRRELLYLVQNQQVPSRLRN